MTFYFVRHGESTWNVERRFQGQLDPPLSDLGILQAQSLARRLAQESRPAAIVSSPLQRARRTAEIIGERCHVPVSLDRRLVEICHGPWQGELETDVARRWPALYRQWHEMPDLARFPEGESLSDVEVRFLSFIGDALAMPSPLLICTHDVLVRLAVLWARHEPLGRFSEWRTENAGITEIEIQHGTRRVSRYNDIEHLDGLRSDVARQAL